MSYIEVSDVSKTYRQNEESVQILHHVSLSVEEGEFLCLLGPSGCGKTTLLNALAGFERVDEGRIFIDGRPVWKPSPEYVTIFQHYGLLPWQSAERNVMLGPLAQKKSRVQARAVAASYLRLVGLEDIRERKPYQLSGGQQQRVAIARALAVEPKLLFMDEPFAALDAVTRLKMQDDVKRIAGEQKITVIFVTHDIEEAVALGDRIVIMAPNPGRIKKIIPVDLNAVRDRTSEDFLRIRDKVFEAFELKPEEKIEYYI